MFEDISPYMTGCDFFNSEEWATQCWEAAKREWTVKETLEAAEDIESVRGQINWKNEAETVNTDQNLGAALADNIERLPVNRETVIEAWQRKRGLPDSCPHEIYTNTRCLFHTKPDRKDPEEAANAFCEVIQEEAYTGRTKQFVGARFSSINLKHRELDAPDNFPIDLRHAHFDGCLYLTDTVVDQPIYFDYARFENEAKFRRTEFADICTFIGTLFESRSDFEWVEFGGKLEFDDAQFRDAVTFTAGTFDSDSDFLNVRFTGEVQFKWADFHGYPDFEDAVFHDEVDFGGVTFYDDVGFAGVVFHGEVLFRTDFGGFSEYEAHIKGVADFRHATFNSSSVFGAVFGGQTTFENATFCAASDFSDAIFEERARFSHAKFTADPDFSRVQFGRSADFTAVGPLSGGSLNIDLTDAVVPAGSFVQPDERTTYYDFSQATVGDIQLASSGESSRGESLFDLITFSQTEFDGFDFTDYKRELSPTWIIHRTNSSVEKTNDDPSELEATYLKAKNGAKAIGDSDAASEFFLKEMYYRRQKHLYKMTSPETALSGTLSAIKWLSNWLYNISCGYGERPLRTFGVSFLTILLFAGLYSFIGEIGVVESLKFSFQSFVAFIAGTPQADISSVLSLMASIEAFFGAFLIALFVFTLTRSLQR